MKETHDLAAEIGVSERTLRRAVAECTIHGIRESPNRLRIPLGEREYVRRSWPLIAGMRAVLRTEPNVRFALLHGSVARGTDREDSDIDVIVDLADPDLWRVVELEIKLSRATGRNVDIVRLEDASTNRGFMANAVGEGRILVDRDGMWKSIRRSAAPGTVWSSEPTQDRVQAALEGITKLLASD